MFLLLFVLLSAPPGAGAALAPRWSFQSSGGLVMPQTFPWLNRATPMRKPLPSLPRGRQLATRPEVLAPPGSSPSRMGVSSGRACEVLNPQPCGLTTRATHSSENGCLRSMLVTMTGISTRNRVQRLVALGVSISIGKTVKPAGRYCVFSSLTETRRDCGLGKRA